MISAASSQGIHTAGAWPAVLVKICRRVRPCRQRYRCHPEEKNVKWCRYPSRPQPTRASQRCRRSGCGSGRSGRRAGSPARVVAIPTSGPPPLGSHEHASASSRQLARYSKPRRLARDSCRLTRSFRSFSCCRARPFWLQATAASATPLSSAVFGKLLSGEREAGQWPGGTHGSGVC